jgi:hypothetical protein
MSDNEEHAEKPKKQRTQKQIEATQRMLDKRKEIDAIKRGHKEALKTEKELKLKDKVNKIKEVEQKMSSYISSEDDEIVEPVKISKPQSKLKSKPKKKVIVQEESSTDDEPEIVYVKKTKAKKKPKKKKVVVEETSSSSSEEEPVKSKKKYATTELVNQRSNDELKAELVNQRLLTAMRSLGYID